MASMSTSASPNIDGHHHVYLQCGKDVEKAFGSHLDYALRERGLRVFWRKETSREGEKLSPETKGVIENVRVFVLIFSPEYVASSGCLEELHEIMKRHQMLECLEELHPNNERLQIYIIPVFYKVKPSDLRWTRGKEGWFDRLLGWFARVLRIPPSRTRGKDGVYAQALRSLERKIPRYESGAINRWRDALSCPSNITGLELEKFSDEAALVKKIVDKVVEFVKKPRFAQPAYPVGLNESLHEFERTTLQEQQSLEGAKVVGIFGSGGKGKSTLAEAFFNRKWSEYGRSSFLCDVRKYPSLDLLKILVKDLISLDLKIDGIEDVHLKIDGIEDVHLKKLEEELSSQLRGIRALIVLDDVDNVEQLNAWLPLMRAPLHSDSLIVLITRNQNILSGLNASPIYEMRGLDAEQSKELFCWHAFHQARPLDGFENIVEDFLNGNTGLVLSLKVLGNNLRNWEDKICNISKMLPFRIPRWTLLDIACVILGEDRNTSIQIFSRGRSLVFVNHEKCCLISQKDVRMRHHLADLMTYTKN